MEELGVIEKQTDSNPWVNDMATAMKPNHKMRLCIDPQHLNKAILREHYRMKTIEDVILEIPEAKVFTKLDATLLAIVLCWMMSRRNIAHSTLCMEDSLSQDCFQKRLLVKSIKEQYQKLCQTFTDVMQ